MQTRFILKGRLRTVLALVFAAAATFTAMLAAPAHGSGEGSTAAPNAVTDWSLIAQNAIAPGRPAGSSEILLAIVHGAIYDAIAAIEGGYEPFASSPAVARPADPSAATAAAARAVLVARVPAQAASVESQYAAYLATIPDGPAKVNGIAVGQAAAAGVLESRASDGLDNSVPYAQPAAGPGVWEPTASTPPVDVKLKQVRPLTFDSPRRFRPAQPLSLDDPEYARDFEEVRTLGSAQSTARTPAQTETARFWAENPFVQWNAALRALAATHRLDVARTARLFALAHVSTADALIGCFEAKYHYLAWRPVHAIRRADSDANPATTADPTWTPLLNVNHPEYPSGHACFTGAVTDAIGTFFATDKVELTLASAVTGTSRTYARLSDIAAEVRLARIWSGLHFRHTMVEGSRLARQTVRHVVRRFFRPVLIARVGARASVSLTTTSGAVVRRLLGGAYRIDVVDASPRASFRLSGPGVERRTGTAFRGRVTWSVDLAAGVYRYGSDARSSSHRRFRAVVPVGS
jgi:hypothetical protein